MFYRLATLSLRSSEGVMRIIVSVVLGFFSGCLLSVMWTLLTIGPDLIGGTFPMILGLVLGWILSTLFLLRYSEAAGRVFLRRALLGAAEWFMMIAVGAVFIGKMRAARAETSPVGLASIVNGVFAFFMALICLTCFAVSHFWNRTMKPNQPDQ